MEKIQKKLIEMSEELEESKKRLSTLEGREHEALRQVLANLDVRTVEEAEKKLSEMEEEQNRLETKIKKKFKELKEVYGW